MVVKFNRDLEQIEIPNSKSKIALALVGAIGFVALGLWFVISPSTFSDTPYHYRPKWEIEGIGGIAILFFGACFVSALFRFFTKKPGLIINNDGIIINSNSPASLVRWDEIKRFSVVKVKRTRLINIYLKNPEKYINRQPSALKRKILKFTHEKFGSLLSLTSTGLKCNFDELYDLLTYKLAAKNGQQKAGSI